MSYSTPNARKKQALREAAAAATSTSSSSPEVSIVPVPSVASPERAPSPRPMEVSSLPEETEGTLTLAQIARRERRKEKKEERAAHVKRTLKRETMRCADEIVPMGDELDFFLNFDKNTIPISTLGPDSFIGYVALSKGFYQLSTKGHESFVAHEVSLEAPNGFISRYYLVFHDNGVDAPYYVHIAELSSPTDLRYLEGPYEGLMTCRNLPTAERYIRRRYRSDRVKATKENEEYRRNVNRGEDWYGVPDQDEDFFYNHVSDFENRRKRGYLTYTFLSSKIRSSYAPFRETEKNKVAWDLHLVNTVPIRNYEEFMVKHSIYHGRPLCRETHLNGVRASRINYCRRGYSSFVSFVGNDTSVNFFGRVYGTKTIDMHNPDENPLPKLYLFRHRSTEKKHSRRVHKKLRAIVRRSDDLSDPIKTSNILKDLYVTYMAKSARPKIFRTRAIIGSLLEKGDTSRAILLGQQGQKAFYEEDVDGVTKTWRFTSLIKYNDGNKVLFYGPSLFGQLPAPKKILLYGDKVVNEKPMEITFSDRGNLPGVVDGSDDIRERTYQNDIVTIVNEFMTHSYIISPDQEVTFVRHLLEDDFLPSYKEFCRSQVRSMFSAELSRSIMARYNVPESYVYRHNYNALRHYNPSIYYSLRDAHDLASIVIRPASFKSYNTPAVTGIAPGETLPRLSNGRLSSEYPVGALFPGKGRYYLATDPEAEMIREEILDRDPRAVTKDELRRSKIFESVTIDEIRAIFI